MVKSKWADQLIADLEQTFVKLRANGIKLNPEKCIFRGPEGYAAGFYRLRAWHRSQPGEDLGHHEDGPDSEYKGGTSSYRVPHRPRPIHFAPWRMRTPLYRLLKKADRFEWTGEAQEALDMVKLLLTKPPVLVPPSNGESLLLYIAATTQVVSAA